MSKNTTKRRAKGEGTIYQLPNKKWIAKITLKTGKRISKTFDKRPDAAQWKMDKLREEKEALEKNNTMLYEYADKWVSLYCTASVSDKTKEMYRDANKRMKKYIPNKPIQEITTDYLQENVNKMFFTYAHSSINQVKILLKGVFEKSIKDKMRYDNPATAIKLKKKKPKLVEALSVEDQNKIEKIAGDFLHGDVIVFMLYTGCRISEVTALEWQNVDLLKNEISIIDSKTASGIRIVPLSKMAIAILGGRKKISDDGIVFKNKNGGQIKYNFDRLCGSMAQKAGITKLDCHMCRHTFVTRMLEKGCNIKVLAEIVGHKDPSTLLRIYAHAMKGEGHKAVALLD